MEQSIIRGIVTQNCPHCGEELFIELQSTAPTIGSVLTEKQVLEAKQEVLRLLGQKLNDADLKRAVDSISDESFLFGPQDIQAVVEQYSTF